MDEFDLWADKLRRTEILRQMGWDEAAIDKMVGITRSPGGLTVRDQRPFDQTGRPSVPREFNTPGTPPGLEPLRRRRGDPGFGVTSEAGHQLHPPDPTFRYRWPPKGPPPTVQGPENIIHQVRKIPPFESRNPRTAKLSGREARPSTEMVKMMIQWENMVTSPKRQLAKQLFAFASKWGVQGIKMMAKLPK